ncbi:MAG: M48 family metalloprotease [Myxococcales bacterium]|nr:M48 family metalloprotease [Myxococcales bacterium]
MAARGRLIALGVSASMAGVALVAAPGCVQDDGSRFNPIDIVSPRMGDDEERKLGMEFDRELRRHVNVINDPVVAGFMSDLGQSIVGTIEPQPFIYRFRVIEDPTLNAFAVPGGYVYFHSGTLLAAGSVDELAGVMGHEIAHVKARHVARMQKQSQIPDLVAQIAGMAAAIATNEPGLAVAAQAINVSLQLRFSREFETEADQLGGIFVTRAGYDPAGSARFFERIIDARPAHADELPPYLYTHPAAEDRIETIRIAAETLRPAREPAVSLEDDLREAQARLALLIDMKRQSVPSTGPPADRSRTDPLLEAAEDRIRVGENDAALVLLSRAQAVEPNDPRVPFQIGNLLYEAGRYEDAAAAYRRTLRLDSSAALVFFQLGLAYKATGERHRSVYAFEQAMQRAGDESDLRRRAEWEILKLTFTVVSEAGFADGSAAEKADTPVGFSREAFREGDPKLAWWARLGPRFAGYADRIRVRWTDPEGSVVQEEPAVLLRRSYIGSSLGFDTAGARPTGAWTVEARLEDDVIDRRTVQVMP